MDEETRKKVEETVLEILRDADMESVTEHNVRSAAAERLGLDLSLPDRKQFVRSVVESFLINLSQEDQRASEAAEQHGGGGGVGEEKDEEEEEEEEEEEGEGGGGKKEYDDGGELIICRLSGKRRVTLREFRGKTLVSIHEFFVKNGRELPTSKGINLTVEQWEAFRNSVPAIEDAIKKLEGSD